MESLDDAYRRRDRENTIEIDADRAHRAWAVLDLVCDGDAFATYGPDYKARDHLAARLVAAGELDPNRLSVVMTECDGCGYTDVRKAGADCPLCPGEMGVA